MPLKEGQQIHSHWELVECPNGRPWERLLDEFLVDPGEFQERHYREFVTFLPHVQRVLYGEGSVGGRAEQRDLRFAFIGARTSRKWSSPLKNHANRSSLMLRMSIFTFFYDADVAILALEVFGK